MNCSTFKDVKEGLIVTFKGDQSLLAYFDIVEPPRTTLFFPVEVDGSTRATWVDLNKIVVEVFATNLEQYHKAIQRVIDLAKVDDLPIFMRSNLLKKFEDPKCEFNEVE